MVADNNTMIVNEQQKDISAEKCANAVIVNEPQKISLTETVIVNEQQRDTAVERVTDNVTLGISMTECIVNNSMMISETQGNSLLEIKINNVTVIVDKTQSASSSSTEAVANNIAVLFNEPQRYIG